MYIDYFSNLNVNSWEKIDSPAEGNAVRCNQLYSDCFNIEKNIPENKEFHQKYNKILWVRFLF